MTKFKVFISSVQAEFSVERQRLYEFIRSDELMSQYFEPFIFEQVAAQDSNPLELYLDEATACQVYLVLVGQHYGNALEGELSPTEQEYIAAGENNAYRVAFIKDLDNRSRDPQEELFFRKVQRELTYRVFSNPSVLVSLAKQSLYAFLKYKGIIQDLSLDERVREGVTMDDIDPQKIRDFIHQARMKRNFPFEEDTPPAQLLQHFRMLRQGKPTNGALLLFAKDPQYYFPSAVVKCAWFLGTEAIKPMEDYKTFEGDIAYQINQATSWVMSKLSFRHGRRDREVQAESEFEIPRSVIFETIVNAVVHRDYNSKGSVQVSVLRNRIVVRNPGTLPVELTKADLMKEHGSYPHNQYIAEAMYQAGYIEKYGTGITENIRLMLEAHLLAPEIDLSAEFVTTIWRDEEGTNIATSTRNEATSEPNRATSSPNRATNDATMDANRATSDTNKATDHLAENRSIIDSIIAPRVTSKMTPAQLRECIIDACIVEHSVDELADLLHKTPKYLRDKFIPELVADGILLPTKPRHSPRQSYFTNPKYK